MDGQNINCYIIQPGEDMTIQVHCDWNWGFIFPVIEDAAMLSLSLPFRLQLLYRCSLGVEMADDLYSVTLRSETGIHRGIILNAHGYSRLVSIVMDSYRQIVPMRKI